jgi:major membrane immunogen (membrane-anchored lipoprotein)
MPNTLAPMLEEALQASAQAPRTQGRAFRAVGQAPCLYRSVTVRSHPSRVDREQRQIIGASIVRYGEARSHSTWLDEAFLDQVVEAGNRASAKGIKARWGHPGASSDALGTFLGRWTNFRREGLTVRADLHLAEAASKSPDGDLATYILDLASEDSDAFGVSIVFRKDIGAMENFAAQHKDADGNFKSPDANNIDHFEHARLASLRAADAVDEPAATDGFFGDGGELPALAEAHLDYLLGVSDEVPATALLGVDPRRARAFVEGYLQRNSLSVVQVSETNAEPKLGDSVEQEGEAPMADEAKPTPAPAVDPKAIRDEALATERKRVADLNAAFKKDAAFANQAIEQGWSVIEAKAQYADKLMSENEQRRADAVKPAKTPAGAEPATFGAGEGSGLSALEVYRQRVAELVKDGHSRQFATLHIERHEPQIHQAMLAEVNHK